MTHHTTPHTHRTYLEQSGPWGTYSGGRALCPDGKIRTLKRISPTADTPFTVPASVTVNGRTVSGYVTCASLDGSDYATADGPDVIRFVPDLWDDNADAFDTTD